MEDAYFTHWLQLDAGEAFIRFGDLPHRIAKALHPVAPEDEEFDFHYGAARLNLQRELLDAVHAGVLRPLDELTRGPQTLLVGPVLEDSLIEIENLQEFLRPRRIGIGDNVTQEPTTDRAGQVKRWTPEALESLRQFRAKYGTKAAAAKFSISEQRVRELLPNDKATTKGFSAFNQRRQ